MKAIVCGKGETNNLLGLNCTTTCNVLMVTGNKFNVQII